MRHVRRKILRNGQQLCQLQKVGISCDIHETVGFSFHARIQIGDYVKIGERCFLEGRGGINIGDGVIFAPEVTILSSSHDYDDPRFLPYGPADNMRQVKICRGVWLGYRSMVRPGVTIGDGAVIGMGSLVVKDVPAGGVVGGNPARILKQRDKKAIFECVERRDYYLRALHENRVARLA